MSKFAKIFAYQIFDSRGFPTIRCKVELSCGACGVASVPAGASKGSHEVIELRDNNKQLAGKSVHKAVAIINNDILEVLSKYDPSDQISIDRALRKFDGTKNLSFIGGNTILAVSLAVAKAAANAKHEELFSYLVGKQHKVCMPVPYINLINGGAHAGNNLGIQEFMIVPYGFNSFSDAINASFEVFYALKARLKSAGVGDEGGFAADFTSSRQALDSLMQAITDAGFSAGKDILLALDIAANELYSDSLYILPEEKISADYKEWGDWLAALVSDYPICSIEDGMSENDTLGWQYLTAKLADSVQLVGDDVFVTQIERLRWGVEQNIANSILIKPNQVGTLTDTLMTWMAASESGYSSMISHRSGDTGDTFIADLAVATNAGQIKTGGLCRSERVEKYNRLLEIEQILGSEAIYAGQKV